jgi:arginine:pyruvate transaminase
VAQCVLNPGDEVIVAEPMYVTYEAVFGACGAKGAGAGTPGARLSRAARGCRRAHHPRTRALALNSPHNPSGASLPRSTWEALAELCIAHDLWLISDEVYSELLFDGEHISPGSLPGMAERTATLNSLSKSHAMTGWRVGWVVGSAGPGRAPGEPGAVHALRLAGLHPGRRGGCAGAATAGAGAMREAYRQRRDLVCVPGRLPGVRALKPDGGMFVMVDIRETGSARRPDRLLDRHGVSVLAGEAFGPSAAGHSPGPGAGAEPLREACRRIVLCAGELMEAQRNA